MKNFARFLDVAPTRFDMLSTSFEVPLFVFISIICFIIFIMMLIFTIKQWKNIKEQNGSKKKFIVELSLTIIFALIFISLCILFCIELW